MNWKKPVKRCLKPPNKVIKSLAILLIKLYQLLLSPYLGRSCRFTPTCSHYAIQSINSYGLVKSFYLIIKRLLKCHPLGPFGYDPVPQPKTLKRNLVNE